MSVWSGIAGTLGKVFSTAGPVMSAIPGIGTIPGVAASAAGGLLNQMASEQNQKDFYKQQLLYNSPKEQMARLKEAGLNPNLIYGSQGVTGMSANDATAPNLEQYKENPVLKMTPQQIQDMAVQRQHQNNEDRMTKSNESLNLEKEKTEQAKQRNLDSDTKKAGEETVKLQNYNSLFDIQKSIYKYQKELAYSNSQLAERQLNIIDSNYNNLVQQVREDLNHTIKSNKLLDAQEAKVIAETAAIPFEILLMQANAGVADENALRLALDNDWLQQESVTVDRFGNKDKKKNVYRLNEAKVQNLEKAVEGKTISNITGNGQYSIFPRVAFGVATSLPSVIEGTIKWHKKMYDILSK